ncbi:MAG: type III-A CRISPR-associated RAMP protein Csm3 [Phototrophicaceae bacterium]
MTEIQIKLYGRIFITGEIHAVTGLHIGGSGGSFTIGGNDNPVLKNPLTHEPYIPGSSLKGKMRSLTEKYMGAKMTKHASIRMHTAETQAEYDQSPVSHIYGVPAEVDYNALPTRLVVRDVSLTEESRKRLKQAKTDLPFTEVKTEVSIDRITSAANPRPLERVPAGAVFGPMSLVYNVYEPEDIERLKVLLDGMALLEDDYLGGSGTRGSGRIAFQQLQVTLKASSAYRDPVEIGLASTLVELSNGLDHIQTRAYELFGFGVSR